MTAALAFDEDDMAGQCDAPDAHSSSEAYAARFSGPTGSYFLEIQTRALLELFEPWHAAQVLDVGGGHGQVAAPLSDNGHSVTVLGSSDRALGMAKALRGRVSLATGDLCHPPFRKASYDVAVSFRMLPHVRDWRVLVAGLCDAARDGVIVDFPIPGGSNALEPLFFGVKKHFEKNTRHFVTIPKSEIRAEFEKHGFVVDRMIGQFVLPMALHRAIHHPELSRALEGILGAVQLDHLIGTPVILRARRKKAA